MQFESLSMNVFFFGGRASCSFFFLKTQFFTLKNGGSRGEVRVCLVFLDTKYYKSHSNTS